MSRGTPEPDRLLEVLAGMATDLDRIHADLGWAWSIGWDAPAQAKPEGARGASLTAPPDDQPDHVAGAKHDIGIGDHRARTAVELASARLWTATRRLASAVQAIQPDAELVLLEDDPDLTLTGANAICRLAAHRVAAISHALERCPRNQRPRGVEHQVLAANNETRAALGILAKVLNAGPIHADPNPEMCRICGIRPAGQKTDNRCSTCHGWYHRHGKRERPSSLDMHIAEEARAAQARRRSRGEDWAASPAAPRACGTTGVTSIQVEDVRPKATTPRTTYRCRPCRRDHYGPCQGGRCTCDCEAA